MPHSAIKPTDAGTDKYSPVTASARMPPMEAKGSTVMISVAERSERNSRNSKKKIAATVTGTITIRCPSARCMFWNCPPHSR